MNTPFQIDPLRNRVLSALPRATTLRGGRVLWVVLSLFSLTGCSTPGAIRPSAPPAGGVGLREGGAEQIRWPQRYEPAHATFFVHNQIDIRAPAAVVWEILIQAEQWPEWYVGAKNVTVKDATAGRLAADAVFTWKTMGMNFESTIREFTPPSRISWESQKALIQGYHAWLLVPTPDGCRVVTDESFRGFLATMQRVFIPKKLSRLHDVFLTELKKKAEAEVNPH